MPELPKVRAFVAVQIDAGTVSAIENFVQLLQAHGDAVSWVKRDNLHVTLRFLGDAVAAEKIPRLDLELARIGAETPPFTLDAHGVGAFPNLERPRVIWVGLYNEALAPLAARVESAARESGFAPETRLYTPHLTIGRIRDLHRWAPLHDNLVRAAHCEFGSSKVDSMILYRSILGGTPTYQELARYALGA